MPANEFPIKITGDVSELTKAANDAKDQLEQASKSVEMLGDMIGIKVPEAIQKMIASSELIGPILSEAFAPLTAITFGIELFEKLSDKIIEVTNDLAGWDASAQAMYADLVKNNEELVKFNQSLDIQKLHLNEIGKTGSERLTQQIENTDAATKEWNKELDTANESLKNLQGSHEETSIIGDGPDMRPYVTEVKNKATATGEVLAHWDENIKKAQASVTELTEKIKQAQEVTRPGLVKEQGIEKQKEEIAAKEQILAANKQVADADRQLAVDTAHAKVQQGKITAAQEEDIILGSFQKERDATIKFLRDREALLLSDTTKGLQEKKTIQETTAIEIHAAEVKSQDETIKVVGNAAQKWKDLREKVAKDIRAIAEKSAKDEQAASDRATREIMANAQKQAQADLKAANEKIAVATKQIEGEIIAAQQGEQAQEALLARDLAQHKISKQQEIEAVKEAKVKELQQEVLYLQQIQSLYDKDTEKWQEIQNRITKIQGEQTKVRAKAAADEAKNTEQQWQKIMSGMQGTFSSFTQGILSGHQTIAQSWTKLVDDMASKFIEGLERQLMEFLVHAAVRQTVEEAESKKSALRNAIDAAGKAYHWAAAWGGPPAGAIAAAVAFTAVESFGSAEGGQYYVPNNQLTMLHPQEMVLPAGIANQMRSVIGGGGSGGSGVTVVVNHSVSAVDAASFQGHIRRHSNMIANEVTRALKRKGVR